MKFQYLNFLVVMVLTGAFSLAAQEATPTVKHTTAPSTSPASGKEML